MLVESGAEATSRAVFLTLLAVSLSGAVFDIYGTLAFGQIDLRNRIVGARAMLEQKNPYTYRWRPGESITLADPSLTSGGTISRVTVTPAVLAVHTLAAPFSYGYGKFGWMLMQFVFYGAIVCMALRQSSDLQVKSLILAVSLAFSCSSAWRMHVERGQVYVFFAFFAALFIVQVARAHTALREFLAGCVLGLLSSFRPQYACLGLPLLIYRRPKVIIGAACGLLFGLMVPSLISRDVWAQYIALMLDYAHVMPLASNENQLALTTPEFPMVIEGATNIERYFRFAEMDTNTSLSAILSSFQIYRPKLMFAIVVIPGIVLWSAVLIRSKNRGEPIAFAVAKTLGLVALVEIALPIPRLVYSNIIVLLSIVFLLATGCLHERNRGLEPVLVVTALLFGFGLNWFPFGGLIPVVSILILCFTARWKGTLADRNEPTGQPFALDAASVAGHKICQ